MSFKCKGWLNITLYEASNVALVTVSHEEDHIHYWNISVPKEIRDFIDTKAGFTVDQVHFYNIKFITMLINIFSYGQRYSNSILPHHSHVGQFTTFGNIKTKKTGNEPTMRLNLRKSFLRNLLPMQKMLTLSLSNKRKVTLLLLLHFQNI